MMSDFREKVFEIIDKVRSMYPYRIAGRSDTYNPYNEAWNDCANQIEVEIEALPYKRPDLSEEERIICKQYLEDLDRHKSCNEYKILVGMLDAPTLGTWISCSKRMPEEHEWIGTKTFGTTISDEVYVTFEAPDCQRFADHINFQNGKLSRSDEQRMKVLYKGAKPIAWMPLPEPYRDIRDGIKDEPTIEPSAQPETAKRIVGKSKDGMTLWYQCDMCNEPVHEKDEFCPGCGRRLTDE